MDAHNDPGIKHYPSQAEILRLHREGDPASPFFKGSIPANGGSIEGDPDMPKPLDGYYEPSPVQLEKEAAKLPERSGTTPFTTDKVTRSIAGLWGESVDIEAPHNDEP
jgi:hypothetical protein